MEIVVTVGDRPSECKGTGGDGSGRGREEGRRRDEEVGENRQELKTGI